MWPTIIKQCKKAFLSLALFNTVINLLLLIVPLYTLQLYDRVLVSQSSETLFYLFIFVLFCLVIYAALEFFRTQILVSVSQWLDNQLTPTLLLRGVDQILLGNRYALEAQHDLNSIKQFLKSPAALVFMDMPWFPIFLIAVFYISYVLGFLTLIGALLLFSLAYINQKISQRDLQCASTLQQHYVQSAEGILQQAEAVQSMGMMTAFLKKWHAKNQEAQHFQSESSNHINFISALSKFFRLFMQVLILTVGAYLAMQGKLTGGAMIAASIITGRALSPVEQFISAWKEFFSASESLKKIERMLMLPETRTNPITLPKPIGKIECDQLIYMPSGCAQPLLQQLQFQLSPGDSMAVIGPSGAGKSTLARLTLGIFPPTRGHIRLDGADVYHWDRTTFGKHVGYLPQDNQLIHGTIKDNIACLTDATDDSIIAAAKMASAHDMILHLPHGYNTPVDGYHLSGGQQKRVALARAFYNNPCLIILDEPETHLDQVGEAALFDAINKLLQQKKTTLVIVTRYIPLIKMMNKTLVLTDGKMTAFDDTQTILDKMKQ